MEPEQHDLGMGALIEHVFSHCHADPVCRLPAVGWIHGRRFELLWNQACKLSDDRRLLRLLLCSRQRNWQQLE